MDVIKVSHLKKYFRDVKAVDDISFVVKKGELFGFLGVNGAGKSTTINILCTLLAETEGVIEVCGYDVRKQSNEVRKKIGVVFQENTLDDMLTVKENLELRGSLYEKDKKTVQKNLEEVTKILDIKDLLPRQFRKLSGGQKRRCEIAKSLMNTPDILFLDEPMTGLDPQTRKQVWESIEKLRAEREMTVFLTTHYMEEAAMAQYLCIMDAGRIVAHESPAELKKQYAANLLKLYTKDIDRMAQEAERLNLSCQRLSNGVAVRLVSTKDAVGIISRLNTDYDGLEIIQGSMDDVFINVTGKRMED